MLREDKRQIFHLLFGLVFVLLLHINRIIGIIGIAAVLFWGLPHYAYCKKKRIPITIKSIMCAVGRPDERGEGAIRYVIGCFVTASFFPLAYSIPAILVFAISDALATMVGIRHGKRQGKSLEGSSVFFLSGFFVLLLFFNPLKALITAIIATTTEFLVKQDNLILAPLIAIVSYVVPV